MRMRSVLALCLISVTAYAESISPNEIEVIDGDTIRVAGETLRLVGFDAQETYRAQCPSELDLGRQAKLRLRALVAAGELDLERVACSCPLRTQGTRYCNHGRSCAVLKTHGEDIASLLISEGLARQFLC